MNIFFLVYKSSKIFKIKINPNIVLFKPVKTQSLEAPVAQLGIHQTLDHEVAGLILTGGVLSLSKTLHPHCLVLVKPKKPSQND